MDKVTQNTESFETMALPERNSIKNRKRGRAYLTVWKKAIQKLIFKPLLCFGITK